MIVASLAKFSRGPQIATIADDAAKLSLAAYVRYSYEFHRYNVWTACPFGKRLIMSGRVFLAILVSLIAVRTLPAQQPTTEFQAFIQKQGLELRADDRPAKTAEEWEQRQTQLRANLLRAWGGFPESPCPLEPRKLGEFQRDGYRVEKLVFQTRPGVWMTANAYVPDAPRKPVPAILHVHGHWSGAKQDPVVQSRCIGCVKLGFFVLCVDAFGAGERGIGKALGEYHGEMTGATLLPIGLPLSGLQVYENMRAVDYLKTRPEVDADRIGITGASGGGNQTMYAGAFDQRFHCVVPTCSVGTYQSYLSAACCMCEVVPNALRFTEEGDILGLAARRGLMVTSATQDAYQFSVGEAKKSLERAESLAKIFPDVDIKHTIIESPHAYNAPMREALYGWMTKHLKGTGDGSPIPDPAIQPEPPEMLRCFPGDSRPDDFVTIPRFAASEARRLAEHRSVPKDRDALEKSRNAKRDALVNLLGGWPRQHPLSLKINSPEDRYQTMEFETEPDLHLFAQRDLPEKPGRLAILIDVDNGAEKAWSGDLANHLRSNGWTVVTPELRATGRFADPRDKIANAPDHNTAEWSLWIGRPLLGQWVWDIRRTLDSIAERDGSLPHDILAIGEGTSGIIALTAAALDERITRVQAIQAMASYVTDQPYRKTRLGIMVPGILRDFGDIADIAAMIAPRPVTISGGTNGAGVELDQASLTNEYARTKQAFQLMEAANVFLVEKGR
jgi:dienelactone hydrolase